MKNQSIPSYAEIWQKPDVAAFVFFVGLFVFLHFGASLISEGRLLLGGRVTGGSVASGGYSDDSGSGEGIQCWSHFRFSAKGREYRFKSNDTDCFRAGESVQIIYLPDDPEVSAVNDTKFGYNYWPRLIFFLIGVALFAGFVVTGVKKHLLEERSTDSDRPKARLLQIFLIAMLPASIYFGLNELRLFGFGPDTWILVCLLSFVGIFAEYKIFQKSNKS